MAPLKPVAEPPAQAVFDRLPFIVPYQDTKLESISFLPTTAADKLSLILLVEALEPARRPANECHNEPVDNPTEQQTAIIARRASL